MEIAIVAIADSANVTVDRKLNILGIFDTLAGSSVPMSHPSMTLAFSLRAESVDSNREIPLDVQLIDVDGRAIFAAHAVVSTGTIAPGQFAHLPQVLLLNMLTFPRFGRYRFRVSLEKGTPMDAVLQIVQRLA